MTLPFNLHEELVKLRWLESQALKADNAVLRQRLKIFPPVEQECAKALSVMEQMKDGLILNSLARGSNKSDAAKALGIGRSTLYKRLKRINGSALVLFAFCSFATAATNAFHPPGTVTLAWDPSPALGVSYRLYAHTNSISETNLPAALVRTDAGTNLTATVKGLSGGVWYFAATAYTTNGTESVPSENLAFEVPKPPQNMRTVILQWSATVDGTNWLDAGYFKVKFGP